MTETKMLRHKMRHYLNTGTTSSPTWSLINKGVSSLTTNFNPEVEEEAGIADEAKSKYTTGLAPETTFDMNVVRGDDANDKIFELCWERKIGSEADVEILTVDMLGTPTGTSPNLSWPAQKETVNVGYNSRGDEAVKPLKISVTLGHMGGVENGTFNPTTGTYTKSS